MRIDPKTAAAYAGGAFVFLMIFGLAWPGPGTWLLVFALLFIAAGAAAWWMDDALISSSGGGAMVTSPGGTPFDGRGAPRTARPRTGQRDSLLLMLGLPGPDSRGRWILPDRVHVTVIAGAIGLLALIIFISGAIGGGGSASQAATVPAVQPNPAIDFAQPVTPTVQASTNANTPITQEPAPIVVQTPAIPRPAPAQPVEITGAPRAAQTITHEVVDGDTIYDLAITYETSIEAIMNANGIGQFDTIHVGDRLLIPTGGN